MASTLIWRTAKRTLVSVRHTAQPSRPIGFRLLAARGDSRVMEAMVMFPLGLGRRGSDRRASDGQAVLEVRYQVVGVLEPN